MGKRKKESGFTTQRIIILALTVMVLFWMVNQGNPPEYFDNFGVGIFVFLTGLSYWMLTTKKELSDNIAFLVLLSAIAGLIVDFSIVFGT